MMRRLLAWVCSLFDRTPVRLAIVRRYQDANGSFVGELYRYDVVARKADTFMGYRMIGASLDTLPLDFNEDKMVWGLDVKNDFLAPISKATVRVGALQPQDNDAVRREIAAIPRWRFRLEIQNRFIERVLDSPRETL